MRQCTICSKQLSAYNERDICFCHQTEPQYDYVPVTLCTSRHSVNNGMKEDNNTPEREMSEFAFTKVLRCHHQENGGVELFGVCPKKY